MGKGNVWVDLAGEGGVPLFKKFAMFDSGFVPAERTCRDAALFRRCRISSLRMDLFIGYEKGVLLFYYILFHIPHHPPNSI